MNKGNGDLVNSPGNDSEEKLNPSLESAIWETTQNLLELADGSSVSVNVTKLDVSSSTSCSNVIADSCLESYLIGGMNKELNEDGADKLTEIVESSTLLPITATETNIDNNNSFDDVVAVNVDLHENVTGARVMDKPISEILKGLKFKKKNNKIGKRIENNDFTKNELLYIQSQMARTKQTAKKTQKQRWKGREFQHRQSSPIWKGLQ